MNEARPETPLSKSERREAARDKARALREQGRKKDRRNRLLLRGGIVLATVGVIAVVTLVIVDSLKPPAPGPLNMLSDGIKIGAEFKAERTAALLPGKKPVPSVREEGSDVFNIQLWVDYFCKECAAFDRANSEKIDTLIASGNATLEIHPVSLLDRTSLGTQYSTRSANAAACVANYAPDSFLEFHRLLLENQPEEGTAGLNDDELKALVGRAGISKTDTIETCISDQKFKKWVDAATKRAQNNPVPGTDLERIQTLPTVIVNGMQFAYTVNEKGEFDPKEFASFLIQVLGAQFTEESTPSPSPSPSPRPSS